METPESPGGGAVLIVTLGRSPGLVPETIDALVERGINPQRVHLVTTNDPVTRYESVPLVLQDFRRTYQPRGMKIFPASIVLPTRT
ncbi:MAG: hypothetical protein Kow0069_00430 [Promethearchaeota archaeon]